MALPKLEALTGPLKSAAFALSEGEVSVGRDSGNVIRITHPSVSRNHCVFRCLEDGAEVYVRDLGSRNGTSVNGANITAERLLKPGDEIQIGSSLFVLTPSHSSANSPSDPTAIAYSVSNDESRFLTWHTVDAAPVTAQIVRFLDALLKASRDLATASSLEEWTRLLLDSVFALTRADRAGLAPPEIAFDFSECLVDLATRQARGSLSACHADPRIVRHAVVRNVSYIDSSGPKPVLIALIRTSNRVGYLYLEGGPGFTDDELHAVSAVATLAGLAWSRIDNLNSLQAENQRLWSRLEHDLIGHSAAIEDILKFIAKMAPVDSNVLLLGESGTGKELVARAIHRNSPRAAKPFLAINCGAIPESLIESELFGVERGAFTGAAAMRKGLFETASGGTVLLDEISELKPAVQPALLRLLQSREVRRVGGTRTIPIDFRLIAASNRNLEDMVKDGMFRADLYHRLCVVSRTLTPLRQRPDDIPLLAQHFVRKFAGRSRPACQGISKPALLALAQYDWPGNVRELENAIERAVVMGNESLVELDDLPESVTEHTAAVNPSGDFRSEVANLKRRLVRDALTRGGSFVEAARILQMNPNYLHRLVNMLGLRSSLPDASPKRADELPVP